MKKCGKCNVEKTESEFRTMKDKRHNSIYLCSMCKECERKMALDRFNANREECIQKNREYKEKNKEKVSQTASRYFQANKDRIRRDRRDYMKNYYLENKDEINKRLAKYRKNNVGIKIRDRLRSRILDCINKIKHTEDYLGTNIEIVKKWLEYNFDDEMTWDNFGTYWHIDHTLPLSLFDMTNDVDVYTCFNWMNLMPLEKYKNISKRNKIIPLYIFHHEKRLTEYCNSENLKTEFDKYMVLYSKYFKKFYKNSIMRHDQIAGIPLEL